MGKKKKEEKKEKARKKEHAAIGPADVSGAVVQAARSVRTVLSRNLLSIGLYAGQDGVMLALAEAGGMTAGALAARLGVKAPTMTRTIGRLEAQGFVERRPDTTDGRLTVVDLTRAGRDSLEKIGKACELSERQALDGLSDKEVRTLLKLLRTVDGNLRGVVLQDGDKPVAEDF
ncbi:MarR family transcriptional regulator [Rhizobium sp. TRM96647]|uniref:MarR family winged helix-turn-helix transcriptional regulator n=1 Tax=unclassified Rhizobium TaxID=2613769 RepID=UPI0021E8F6A6|nr:MULTISPECIES: MarR family transcriptional regulator [unclassified Rhizobium]MCV3735995.1 MarR family transcriptional regulator [Rhizobium sp. TRM96647]MCV3758343.1 MarR family transcriptional regulator [Rhizobium sp. TRM96650]